jgi:hypothetical protein
MALLGTLQVRLGRDTATFGQKLGGFTKDSEKRAKVPSQGVSDLTGFGSLVRLREHRRWLYPKHPHRWRFRDLAFKGKLLLMHH